MCIFKQQNLVAIYLLALLFTGMPASSQTAPIAGTPLWSAGETNDAVLVDGLFVYVSGRGKVIKKSAVTGSPIWTRNLDGGNLIASSQHSYSIKKGSDGGIFVVHNFFNSTSNSGGHLVAKYDTDGNFLWDAGTGITTVNSVAIDRDDNIYVAGKWDDGLNIVRGVIKKISSQGVGLDSKYISRRYDEVLGIVMDQSDNLYYTSYDPENIYGPQTGLISKDGVRVWTNSYGGTIPMMAISTNGVLCVCSTNGKSIIGLSTTNGLALWTNNLFGEKLISDQSNFYIASNAILTKITDTGVSLWTNKFRTLATNQTLHTFGLAVSPSGYVYQNGYFTSYYVSGLIHYTNVQSFMMAYTREGVACYTNYSTNLLSGSKTYNPFGPPMPEESYDNSSKGYAGAENSRVCSDQFDNVYSVDFPTIKLSGPAPSIYANSNLVDSGFASTTPVAISMVSGYRDPSSVILYTLDNTLPDYNSPIYSTPITISNTTIIHTLGVDVNTFEQIEGSTIVIVINNFALSITNQGAGNVVASPATGPYLSNTVVTLTATPSNGWAFSNWAGDLTGTNNPTTITMTASKAVTGVFVPVYAVTLNQPPGGGSIAINPSASSFKSNSIVTISATALQGWTFMGWSGDASGTNQSLLATINAPMVIGGQFGTTLSTGVLGSGAVVLNKDMLTTYPYGTIVRATAIPNPGYYFTKWGSALSGTNNPEEYSIISTNPARAFFGALPVGSAALTIQVNGAGDVFASPLKAYYTVGDTVMLTATPRGPTNQFSAWSGDLVGFTNSQMLTMNTSKAVTALFAEGLPALQMTGGQSNLLVVLSFKGTPGYAYVLQAATNLTQPVNWKSVFTNVADTNGIWNYTATNLSGESGRFYRTVSQ